MLMTQSILEMKYHCQQPPQQKYYEKNPYQVYTCFEHKMELSKIPLNCQFLQPKRTNVEILLVIPPSSCSRDRGIQDIQTITTAASAFLILQAASDVTISSSCIKKLGKKNQHHASTIKNKRCPFPSRESKSRIKPVQEEHN